MQAIEIEVDTPTNDNLHFRPLTRSIRGRFDMMRMGEPLARVKATEWPPIPSQRLGITPDGIGYLVEPLHDPQHSGLKTKIERAGMTLEQPLTQFDGIHLPSWLFWMKQACDSGMARVTKGQLPDQIDGTPRHNFIIAEPAASDGDKLATALADQAAAFNRLTDAILQLVAKK